MIRLTTPDRGVDVYGSGAFGAPRGRRKHRGVDFAAAPGSLVHAVRCGMVTKLGYPYADDLSFRYVQVTTNDKLDMRYFYVDPLVRVGDFITLEMVIGTVQDLDARYMGIKNHIHLEVRNDQGEWMDYKKLSSADAMP